MTEPEREQMRRWLRNWTAVRPLLEAERDERLAALTDDDAWRECQALFAAWDPDMQGDAGERLTVAPGR